MPNKIRCLIGQILLLTATAAGAQTPPVITQNLIVIGCALYKPSGEFFRWYPGMRCRFLPDGSFLSKVQRQLTYYKSDFSVAWRIPMHVHHLINMTEDGRVLITSSSEHRYGVEQTRFDVLKIITRDGKIQKSFDFFDHLKDFEKWHPLPKPNELRKYDWDNFVFPDVIKEFSHANSFYEIPDNPIAAKIPAFHKGNFVVNVNGLGYIYIFDKNLSQILWALRYQGPRSDEPNVLLHDVQILKNGHLLIYVNEDKENGVEFSSLNEYDPVAKKTVWRYQATPPKSFHARVCGGVQILNNGNILFSNDTNGGEAVEITRDGNGVRRFSPHQVQETTGKTAEIQDAKLYDLSGFLAHNHGI